MTYLDPKADLTFKKIFGNHPKRLISLLFFYSIGTYAQGKEAFYNNDSVDTCPLADKELIDTCYDLLDRNMLLETDGMYGQIAVIDAAVSNFIGQ